MTYKYTKLVDWVKDQIKTGDLKAGDRLPTEAALVEKFSVSRHTVRQAFKALEEENLLYSVQGSGSYISESLKEQVEQHEEAVPSAVSNVIGIVLQDGVDYIFPEIIQGASEYLLSKGYLLNVSFGGGKVTAEKQLLKKLLDANLAGAILEPLSYGVVSPNDDLYMEMYKKMPILLLHTDKSQAFPSLGICDSEGGYQVGNFLIEKGHRNIGTIFAFDEATASNRYAGFLRSLSEHGVEHNDDNDVWIRRSNFKDLFQDGGDLVLKRMLKDVTAIFCHDDRVAYELALYLRDKGIRIPEDISLVGYDDSSYATLDTQITSVTHPKKEYGIAAAKAILEMINHPDSYDLEQFIIHPKLIVRESVKDLRKE